MSKRKPPSQRPERQLTDVAKAIGRVREDQKAEKSANAEQTKESQTVTGRDFNATKGRKAPAPMPSTKRPKKV